MFDFGFFFFSSSRFYKIKNIYLFRDVKIVYLIFII